MADLNEVAQSLIKGQAPDVEQGVQQALDEGVPVREILHEGLIAGMNVVGAKFKNNEFYIPEVLIAARAMKAGMELIRPKLIEEKVEPAGIAAIGTVKGDLHDIGKNLVGSMLEGGGFEVFDLGTDVAPEQFVEAAKEHKAHIIALSALLTTTMPSMKLTVEAFIEDGTRDQVKIFIGGAPVTQEFADEIGADGYSKNAVDAVAQAKQWMAASA